MPVTIDGTNGVTTPGVTNSEGYSGDGLTIAAGAPAGAVQVGSSGNVGLGVTPSAWSGYTAFDVGSGSASLATAGGTADVTLNAYNNAGWKYKATGTASFYRQQSGAHYWFTAPSGTAGNAISFTQAMTLDASGNVLVGKTTNTGPGKILSYFDGATTVGISVQTSLATTGSNMMAFYNSSGGVAGTINHNGSTTVAYNTSSDYRLKENIQPMTGALTKVAALKPVTYTWKADGSAGQGFIAHELQQVVPDCVTGEKDAVETYTDENGNEQTRPVYQGIDTSFLVATLTAAIQEQQAMIESLTARVAALEAK